MWQGSGRSIGMAGSGLPPIRSDPDPDLRVVSEIHVSMDLARKHLNPRGGKGALRPGTPVAHGSLVPRLVFAVTASALCACSEAAVGPSSTVPDASLDVSICSSDAGTVPPSCPADGGACVIAAGQTAPWAIAVDSARVYWTTLGNASGAGSATGGTVMAAGLQGGSAATIASGLSLPYAIATDGENVYWADNAGGALLAASTTAAGAPVTIVSGLGDINAFVVNAGSIYANPGGSVVRAAIDGGSPQVVVADAGAGSIAADTAAVYWGALKADGGALFSAPLDGGTSRELASLPWSPVTIVVDGDTIFWTVFNGYVMRMPRGGGTPTTIASGLNAAYGLAVDSAFAYWTTQDAVMKAPKGGGVATTIAASPATVLLAVNDAGVYWTTSQIAPCVKDLARAGAVIRAPLSP